MKVGESKSPLILIQFKFFEKTYMTLTCAN